MNYKQIKNETSKTANRTKKISFLFFISVILITCAILLIYTSLTTNKSKIITYNDKSNLDYKVFYKENDYFSNYVGKNQQYIASLIDYIEANFDYKMTLNENIQYSYYYYVDAEVNVIDNSGKPLYQKKEELIPKKKIDAFSNDSFEIKEKLKLDYNYYNNIVKTFVNRYKLYNTKNYVTVKMYVGIMGNCDGYSGSISDNSVISMKVPLTSDTINIDLDYNLINGKNKELKCIADAGNIDLLIVLGIVLLLGGIGTAVYEYSYIISTRSPLTIYNRKLKSIFNNYGRYISKIKTELKYDKFQIVLVEEFEDLFEARNSSQSPILFSQNREKTKSAFVVPTNSGLVYIYYLTVGKNKGINYEKNKNEKIEIL